MNIVFVCTSNTCRSPISELFAVEWFHRRLKLSRPEQEAKGIIVRSGALTDVFDKQGSPASEHAVAVMRKYEIDLSAHRSKLLTAEMVAQADYVVCVASGIAHKLAEQFPQVRERPGVLCAFSRDMPDPWHMEYDTYMENVALNEELTREFLDNTVTF